MDDLKMSQENKFPRKEKGVSFSFFCGRLLLVLPIVVVILIAGWIYSNQHCHGVPPYNIVVHLENGFIYNLDNWHDDYRVVTEGNGKVVIRKDVHALATDGKTIYGKRNDVLPTGKKELFFFICVYGEDCSKTQNYDEEEFKKQLKKRNLLPFDKSMMMDKKDLMIWEWKKSASLSDLLCYLYLYLY